MTVLRRTLYSVLTCATFLILSLCFRADGNKVYPLNMGSVVLPVFCHMTDDLGDCGGGGWTLVMKINGSKVFKTMLVIIVLF